MAIKEYRAQMPVIPMKVIVDSGFWVMFWNMGVGIFQENIVTKKVLDACVFCVHFSKVNISLQNLLHGEKNKRRRKGISQ